MQLLQLSLQFSDFIVKAHESEAFGSLSLQNDDPNASLSRENRWTAGSTVITAISVKDLINLLTRDSKPRPSAHNPVFVHCPAPDFGRCSHRQCDHRLSRAVLQLYAIVLCSRSIVDSKRHRRGRRAGHSALHSHVCSLWNFLVVQLRNDLG